jgi:cytochrome c oxidase cbb3-type subunit 4
MFGISYEIWLQFQVYGYFIMSIILVVLFYSYIYHLYKSQKSGRRDYEKYSKLALDDNLNSEILEDRNKKEK